MSFQIGDKVVCVDDSRCGSCGCEIGLTKNQVYVCAGYIPHSFGEAIILLGWTAKCADQPAHSRWPKNCANAKRFRKLDELKAESGKRLKALKEVTATLKLKYGE
jgi:hypothetical protein